MRCIHFTQNQYHASLFYIPSRPSDWTEPLLKLPFGSQEGSLRVPVYFHFSFFACLPALNLIASGLYISLYCKGEFHSITLKSCQAVAIINIGVNANTFGGNYLGFLVKS